MISTLNPSLDLTADKPPRTGRWIPLSLRGFVAMFVFSSASPRLLSIPYQFIGSR